MIKFLIVLFTLVLLTNAKLQSFDGSTVYSITLNTQSHVDNILKMYNTRTIDVWSDNIVLGSTIDIRVPKENKQKFENYFFTQEKLIKKIQIQDVQKLINAELKQMSEKIIYKTYKNKNQEDDFFRSYRTLEEIDQWTRDRVAKHPGLATLFNMGKSYEKRDQLGIRITSHLKDLHSKPAVFIHGAIHAREWVSPTTVMWIANELLTKSSSDPKVKMLVDNMTWYIAPVANPDGYAFTHSNNRMWRKTREPTPGSRCFGVDPNRNFEYKWNTGGSSSDPCSDSYHGPKGLSSVETQNIWNFGKNIPNLRTYVDYHAFTQLWMRPWGWSRNEPSDEAELKRIGDRTATAITNKHRYRYRSGRIAVIIYVASGSSADHFYGNLRIPSFGVELRPSNAWGGGFMLPARQIIPTGEENFEGAKQFADMALKIWEEEQQNPKTK